MKDWTTLYQGQTVFWTPSDDTKNHSWKAEVIAIEDDHALAVTEDGMELYIDDDTCMEFVW